MKRIKVEQSVAGLEVRKDILENAKNLVLERQREEENDQKKLMQRIEMMDKKLSKLTNQFDLILEKLK